MSEEENNSIAAQVASQAVEIKGIKEWMEALSRNVNKLADLLQSRQQTNWGNIIAALMFSAILVGAFWTIMSLQIQHVEDVANLEVEHQGDSFNLRLSQVETQFDASAKIENLHLVEEMRTRALLWQQVYGQPYPDYFYAPEAPEK